MKVKMVSALRKRGLRREGGAEPQMSEWINPNKRKADTMKTYLLKIPASVEPKARRPSVQAAKRNQDGAPVGVAQPDEKTFPARKIFAP
jgi:hypothetical protein